MNRQHSKPVSYNESSPSKEHDSYKCLLEIFKLKKKEKAKLQNIRWIKNRAEINERNYKIDEKMILQNYNRERQTDRLIN